MFAAVAVALAGLCAGNLPAARTLAWASLRHFIPTPPPPPRHVVFPGLEVGDCLHLLGIRDEVEISQKELLQRKC